MGRENLVQDLRPEKSFSYAESEGSTSPDTNSQSSFNGSPESLKSSKTSARDGSEDELQQGGDDDDVDELHSDDVIHGECHFRSHETESHMC